MSDEKYKNHMKMPVSKRAKQFMPFAAVTGLDEALRKKEEEFERLIEDFEKSVREANDQGV